jgi:hypothetical protein
MFDLDPPAPSINFPNTFHQLFLLARGSGGLYPQTSPEFHHQSAGKPQSAKT